MGSSQSYVVHGTLPGGSSPRFQFQGASPDPDPVPYHSDKPLRIVVPPGVKEGETIQVRLPNGESKAVRVPKGLRPGDKFNYKIPFDHNSVFVSTGNTIPGMQILQTKKVVYSTAFQPSYGYFVNDLNLVATITERLMEQAHAGILEKAAADGCNAVIGLNYSITTDSAGDRGTWKIVMVSAFGTPCIVAPVQTSIPLSIPVAFVEAEPLTPDPKATYAVIES